MHIIFLFYNILFYSFYSASKEWKIFFSLQFSPVDIRGSIFWTLKISPRKCPEPTFFFYLGSFVHKVEGSASSIVFGRRTFEVTR